jgi:ribonuclease VapC
MEAATHLTISAVTVLETTIVAMWRAGDAGRQLAQQLIVRSGILVEAFTPAQLLLAQEGFARYGKGRDPAALNFGDCFSYALSKEMGEPLLFKGDDFAKTDVEPVRLPRGSR